MTTDTKAVARFDSGSGVNPRANGKYVLFTDHELAVGRMEERVVNMKSWARHDREMIEVLETELETLRAALAASRAEVEGLIEVAKVYLHGEYQDPEVEYSSEYRARRYKEGQALAKAIDAAMEKGNV